MMTYISVVAQEMEKEKQDHKQKISEIKQSHDLEMKGLEYQQKLQIRSLMTKARIGRAIYSRTINLAHFETSDVR